MTILVSGHFVYAGRVGGAEHMVYNLVRGMAGAGARVTFLCSDRRRLGAPFGHEDAAPAPVLECGGGGPRFLAEQRACLDPRLSGEAILFPNYYVPPVVPDRLGRVAVVIHDFQYRHFPEHFSAKKRVWLRLAHAWAYRRAETVIVISDFVRQDAIRLYGRSAEKSVVIPNPVSWERFGVERGPHPLGGRPYVLAVAAHYPHKRLDVVIRAFARLRERRPDLRLVLAGQLASNLVSVGAERERLPGLIHDLGIGDAVTVTGYVDDRQLGDLYHHAAAFAFPSVFEGFGMPAVEALGFGVPTLTTRCTALPETTLGLAEYVEEAGDVTEWADRLDRMIDRPRLDPAAVERVRDHYSPTRIGRRYADALAA